MVNILFDCPNVDDFTDELGAYFSAHSRVAVVALSFYDDWVYDAESWERVYGRRGEGYLEVVDALSAFGVKEEGISFINYFTDTRQSAIEKIRGANVLYFTGGLPDRMMERIEEMGIAQELRAFDGVVFGYSAGAVIQLREYHLYPDADYPDYGYYNGLGYVDGVYLEVHYEYKPEQDESIRLLRTQRSAPVYVTHTRGGGIICEGGKIKTVGRVDVYAT